MREEIADTLWLYFKPSLLSASFTFTSTSILDLPVVLKNVLFGGGSPLYSFYMYLIFNIFN